MGNRILIKFSDKQIKGIKELVGLLGNNPTAVVRVIVISELDKRGLLK